MLQPAGPDYLLHGECTPSFPEISCQGKRYREHTEQPEPCWQLCIPSVLMPGMALMGCQLPQGAKTLKDFRLVESQNHRTV